MKRLFIHKLLGKEHPDLPAELFYTADELEVLGVKKETAQYASSAKLTVLQANLLVAMLAGFWARASDGHPGALILAEGLRVLQVLVWYKVQCARQAQTQRKRRGPT